VACRRAAAAVVKPTDIPETHPDLADLQAELAALGEKPQQDAFDDYSAFEAARDTWIENRATIRAEINSVRKDVARREAAALDEANRAAQEQIGRWEKAVNDARARHADYDSVMAAANHLTISRDMQIAMAESDLGADVAYHLAKHPAEVMRLNGLSTHRALAELGIIEGRLRAGLRSTPPAPARPGARTTKAPEPQGTTLGDFAGPGVKRDLNDPNLSQAEYNRLRDEMDAQNGRYVASATAH
jgi:hypothetical protein